MQATAAIDPKATRTRITTRDQTATPPSKAAGDVMQAVGSKPSFLECHVYGAAAGISREVVMATLSFEAETHPELVAKVRRWLASVDGTVVDRGPAEVVEASAELTKEALRIVASAAPGPVAESEVVKGLTALGYQAADASSKAVVDALDALSAVTGGSVVKRARDAAQSAVWEMNAQVAKQVLKSLAPKPTARPKTASRSSK
jgi:hypothetical protein